MAKFVSRPPVVDEMTEARIEARAESRRARATALEAKRTAAYKAGIQMIHKR